MLPSPGLDSKPAGLQTCRSRPVDHLIEIGLLGRGAHGLHWNAHYFAVFHF